MNIVVQACFPVWVSAGPVLSSGISRWSNGILFGLLTSLCTPLYPALPIYFSLYGVGASPSLQAVSSIFSLETCSRWPFWLLSGATSLEFWFAVLRDGRAWWAAIYGVTQSWTRLKQLSNSSNHEGWRTCLPVLWLKRVWVKCKFTTQRSWHPVPSLHGK